MNRSKGMTLLEMLVSLGIFTFMFIFITQVVKQSQRQVRKIKQEIHKTSSFDHVIELIKKDFNSVSFLLDLNDNFRHSFPVKRNLDESSNRLSPDLSNKKLKNSSQKNPVFMSPYFIFKGEEDKIEFVSYSLTDSAQENSLEQWMQIRYFIQDCPDVDKSSSSSCLLRSSKRYWNLERERGEGEALVLFRGFKSLKFSYLISSNVLNQEWRDSWKLERSLSFPGSSIGFPQELPFPFRVKLEVETQDTKQTWSFNVAGFYLRYWNPFNKEFFTFPKWKPPKKTEKPKPQASSVR